MEMVGLTLNVNKRNLDNVLSIIQSMKSPTLSDLSRKGWFDIFVVLREKTARDLIPKLKKAGAQDIVEFPLKPIDRV